MAGNTRNIAIIGAVAVVLISAFFIFGGASFASIGLPNIQSSQQAGVKESTVSTDYQTIAFVDKEFTLNPEESRVFEFKTSSEASKVKLDGFVKIDKGNVEVNFKDKSSKVLPADSFFFLACDPPTTTACSRTFDPDEPSVVVLAPDKLYEMILTNKSKTESVNVNIDLNLVNSLKVAN